MFFGIFVTAKKPRRKPTRWLWIGQNLCSLVYLLQLVMQICTICNSCELVKIYVLWYICYSLYRCWHNSWSVVNWSKFMFFGIFVTAFTDVTCNIFKLWIGQNLCSLVYLLQLYISKGRSNPGCELVKIYVLWYICYSFRLNKIMW